MDLDAFRQEFPSLAERSYLFAGAICPPARAVSRAITEWVCGWNRKPLDRYDEALELLEGLRVSFAHLIGATTNEVAITDGTSRAALTAVGILAARDGGHVVFDETTYPSSRYAWLSRDRCDARHINTEDLDTPQDAFAPALDGARALVVSHVAPLTGRRHQLEQLAEVAHRKGALLMVDAAQSTGVLEINVRRQGIDVLVTTAMKWLLGPPGIGFLYMREELLDDPSIIDVGYLGTVIEGEQWPVDRLPALARGARRVEPGLPALPLIAAADAGLGLVTQVGVDVIAARVESLATMVIDGLRERAIAVRTPNDPTSRAGVVAADFFRASELGAFLRSRGVDIGGYPWGLLRVDPHAYCTKDDVRRFLLGVDAFVNGENGT